MTKSLSNGVLIYNKDDPIRGRNNGYYVSILSLLSKLTDSTFKKKIKYV